MKPPVSSHSAGLPSVQHLYRQASILAGITIGYNIAEGLVSISLGAADETLSLFGFGIDSFVEVVSGIGIWHMTRRIRARGEETRDRFEQQALRITGRAFYVLAAGLAVSAVVSLQQRHAPKSTLWGIVVSLASLLFMWLLIRKKTAVGNALNSAAILADAACSKACLYLSFALLASSAGYALTGVGGFDAIGALLIAWFSFAEGKEALKRAEGIMCGECCRRD